MQFRLVSHGSEEYERTIALRRRILRKPLGLDFSPEEIAGERTHVHVAAFAGDSPDPVACLVLEPATPDTFQLRQMAVVEEARRQRLGSELVAFAEDHARRLGKKRIFCHARHYVIPFYEKLGYRVTGAPFQEVGITHVRMEKDLI